MSAASSSSPLPAAAVAEATSSTSANDVIANPFSFSGFSDELFGEIDLDDIDVGKTTGTDDNIDDDAFFEDFAIDSDGEGEEASEEASGVAAPAATSSLTASPPPSPQQQQKQQKQQYVVVDHPLAQPPCDSSVATTTATASSGLEDFSFNNRSSNGGTNAVDDSGFGGGGGHNNEHFSGIAANAKSIGSSLVSFAGSLASKVESTIVAIPKTTSTSSTATRDEEVDARLRAAFASRRVTGVSSAAATTALSSTATTTTTAGGGGGIPSVSSGMTYQERQRIMLTSNPTNAVTGGPSTLVSAAPTMVRIPPPPAGTSSSATQATCIPSTMTTNTMAVAETFSIDDDDDDSNMDKNTVVTTSTSTTATNTFVDKLNERLDTKTKTRLINSALGSSNSNNLRSNEGDNIDDESDVKLLPGERVIMFLNALEDVRDSTTDGNTFVGSSCDVLLGQNSRINNNNGSDSGDDIVTVWCCVMTFYRVAVFSYQATSDGQVLLPSTSDDNGIDNHREDKMIQGWLNSQSVSIQFQAAYYRSRQSAYHHVFQMPLASIERVEKTLSSSQRSTNVHSSLYLSSSSSSSSAVLSAASHSKSSSSTANAMINSAMVSLGSQIKKELLGTMARDLPGSTSNFNLLTNGIHGSNGNSMLGTSSMGEPLGIILHGKDGGRWIEFSTCNSIDAQRAHEALNTYAFPGRRNLGYLFAFESRRAEVMAATADVEKANETSTTASAATTAAANPTRRRFVPLEEYERQGIFQMRRQSSSISSDGGEGGGEEHPSPWAPILTANANYGLCATYPSVLVGPTCIVGVSGMSGNSGVVPSLSNSPDINKSNTNKNDNNIGMLRRCAAFRSENRLPALTWGNPRDGGSIWRSAQPKVGLQGNRNVDDERYLYAIGVEARRATDLATKERPPIEFLRMLCGRNNESDLIIDGGNGSSSCLLKVMDMRPKTSAMANRTQGYGYENTSNYCGTTIDFYGIGNIHAVRDAYQKMTTLCMNPYTSDIQWMQQVENTNWLSIIRLVLSASWQTAFHVHYNRIPVLLHCSVSFH